MRASMPTRLLVEADYGRGRKNEQAVRWQKKIIQL